MKKRILAVILSIMVALSIPSALVGAYYNLPLDVGNFNDYGGGGDWGGGTADWGGNDYGGGTTYYDYDDDSDDADPMSLLISIIVIVAIIGISIYSSCHSNKNKNNNKTNTSYSSYETPAQFMPADFTTKITEFIKQTDIDFNAEKFIAWSKNIFITLQTAWSERDWEKIRTLEKEELFEQHNTQLQEYIRLGRINCIERINVNQAFLHKYVRDDNFENLTVCMKVRMIDYIIDEKSGKVLNGSKTDDVFMTYLLTFTRRKGIKTTLIDGVIANSCPHCGAPVDSASAGRCEYCGSIVHSGEFNWVLSDMQAVKPGFNNDNRGIILLDENNNNQN